MNFLEIGVPALNIAVFAVFVIATMTIIVKVTSCLLYTSRCV